MTWLQEEMTKAALAVGPSDVAHVRRLGAINEGVARMGLKHHQFGLMTVSDGDEGLFYPSQDGRRRLVVPVHEDGELIDLVAFSTATPDDWRLRTGAGLALGLFDGWEPHRWSETVALHRNPLDWLRAGGDGLCIIDWSAPDIYVFNDLPHITVTDEALRCQLVSALTRPAHLVPISIEKDLRLAA